MVEWFNMLISKRHRDAARKAEEEAAKMPAPPRLGRRESEPHSMTLVHIYEVLQANFEGTHHALWDLHHYFKHVGGTTFDLQFDVSFFLNFHVPKLLPSYKAWEFGNRVPDVAFNIMSRSTWRNDLSEISDICAALGIPVYVVFAPYHVASQFYKPPFLRVYLLQEDGTYKNVTVRHACLREDGSIELQHVVQLPQTIPFWVGLTQTDKLGPDDVGIYQLVLIDPDTKRPLQTKTEHLTRENQQLSRENQQLSRENQQMSEQLRHLSEQVRQLQEDLQRYRELLKKYGILTD